MKIEVINTNMYRKTRTGADFLGVQGTSGYSGISGYLGISGYSGRGMSSYLHTQSAGATDWNIVHPFGKREVLISTYDYSWNQITPQNILLASTTSSYVSFNTTISGYAVVIG